jgi:CRISPR-associated protein Cmr5
MPTREQERAQRAYERVHRQRNDAERKQEADYQRFAKRFPALIQSCGLAQALAFAEAKEQKAYLSDLAHVITKDLQAERLTQQAREEPLPVYQKLTRDTLAAATWLKRYSEAVLRGEDE